MSTNTIAREELTAAVTDMTGAVDIVEAAFTPWDDDQAAELEAILARLNGLDALDRAVFGEDA